MVSGHCGMKGIVYKITCLLCITNFYIGVSERTVYERFSEHKRYASNPSSTSYKEECLLIHYREQHIGQSPKQKFDILESGLQNTVRRKIIQAYHICNQKPTLNNKKEYESIERFFSKVVNAILLPFC